MLSCWVATVVFGAANAASATDLSDLISTLYTEDGRTGITLAPFGGHEAHFEGEALTALSSIGDAVSAAFNTRSPSATAASFTFDVSQGVFVRSTESLGPIFSERPQTIGKNKLNISFNFTDVEFDRFEGENLDSLRVVLPHQDDPPAGSAPPQEFEDDTVVVDLDIELEQKTFAFGATFGVTDHWEVGIVLPYVDTELRVSALATPINTTGTDFHFFSPAAPDSPFSSVKGDESGLGDIILRTKYHFLRPDRADWTPDMAAVATVRLATGDDDDLLGTGEYALLGGIVSSWSLGRFTPHIDVGYQFTTGPSSDDNLRWLAGVDIRVMERLALVFEALGRHELRNGDGVGDDQLDFVFGAKVNPWKNLVLNAFGQIPLNRRNGLRSDLIYGVGVEYSFF